MHDLMVTIISRQCLEESDIPFSGVFALKSSNKMHGHKVGNAHIDPTQAMNTPHNIASQGKMFTQAAIMMLGFDLDTSFSLQDSFKKGVEISQIMDHFKGEKYIK